MAKYEFAIFIENDLILAPDFLWYFRLAAPLLDRDPSLWCVSSWNDNGFQEIVSDELRLFRTDYFPGLGWMIRSLAASQFHRNSMDLSMLPADVERKCKAVLFRRRPWV